MTGGVSTLANRIVGELDEVQRVARHVQKDWQNFLRTADDGYLKATAFDLHSFYTGWCSIPNIHRASRPME